MASTLFIAIVHDGAIQITGELGSGPRFCAGAQVKRVPLETPPAAAADWRRYGGLFADPDFDTTEWKRQERELELAHDERKFGTKRPSW